MAVTTKPLKKFGVVREVSAGSYLDPTTLVPVTSCDLKQSFDLIPDESLVGVCFPNAPLQGVRKCGGKIVMDVDALSSAAMLVAMTGTTASPYDLHATANNETLSITDLNEVKLNKRAGCSVSQWTITSQPNKALSASLDILGFVAESRATPTWPGTITINPGTLFLHHHLRSTGYARIGDQADALAAGDAVGLEEVVFGGNWNRKDDFDNTSQGSLQQLSGGGGRPSASLSFKISRHDSSLATQNDTVMGWRDAGTLLQMELYYYASATATLKVQIPNFRLSDADPTGDAISRIACKAGVGRNGIGASYVNSYMALNAPIRLTLVNS